MADPPTGTLATNEPKGPATRLSPGWRPIAGRGEGRTGGCQRSWAHLGLRKESRPAGQTGLDKSLCSRLAGLWPCGAQTAGPRAPAPRPGAPALALTSALGARRGSAVAGGTDAAVAPHGVLAVPIGAGLRALPTLVHVWRRQTESGPEPREGLGGPPRRPREGGQAEPPRPAPWRPPSPMQWVPWVLSQKPG